TAASGPVPGWRRSSLDIEAQNQPRKERFMSRSTFCRRTGVILVLTAFVLGVSAAAALGWGGGGGEGGYCCQKSPPEGKDHGNKPSENEKEHGNKPPENEKEHGNKPPEQEKEHGQKP